ncbi:MAG: hypothetical protein Q8920_12985 [Bacillota bacterium]|nr:hypothetical protein [Bacillota bacterium]
MDLIISKQKCKKEMCIYEKMIFVLKEAQGCSIEMKRKPQPMTKTAEMKSIPRFSNFDSSNFEVFPDYFFSFPKVETKIITGNMEVHKSMIALIQAASQKEGKEEDPILITYNKITSTLPVNEDKAFLPIWDKATRDALNRGWNIVPLIRVDNNIDRMMKIIHDLMSFLAIGNYTPYYMNRYFMFSTGREMLVVPGIGAMITFPAVSPSQIECALYVEDKNVVKMFFRHFYYLLSMTQPLVRIYSPEESKVFLWKLIEYEERYGSRCHYAKDINSLTVPSNLYERYLKTVDKPLSELTEAINLHKRRLGAFISNVKDYKYKDICTIESIERLIHYLQYPSDNLSMLSECKPTKENIIEHIENIIFLLEKYKNYEMAIVNETQLHHDIKSIWIIDGKATAFTKTKSSGNMDNNSYKLIDQEIYISFNETTVVSTFKEYFMDLWDSISPINKEKKEVIAWLKTQIEHLKGREYKPFTTPEYTMDM